MRDFMSVSASHGPPPSFDCPSSGVGLGLCGRGQRPQHYEMFGFFSLSSRSAQLSCSCRSWLLWPTRSTSRCSFSQRVLPGRPASSNCRWQRARFRERICAMTAQQRISSQCSGMDHFFSASTRLASQIDAAKATSHRLRLGQPHICLHMQHLCSSLLRSSLLRIPSLRWLAFNFAMLSHNSQPTQCQISPVSKSNRADYLSAIDRELECAYACGCRCLQCICPASGAAHRMRTRGVAFRIRITRTKLEQKN